MSASADYFANAGGALSLDKIDSLFVRITGISVLRIGEAADGAASGWLYLELAGEDARRVNLLTLAEEDSLLLAKGDLEPGTYHNLRLEFDSASIVLNTEATVGGQTFQKDSAYTLRVPSGLVRLSLPKFTIATDSTSTLKLEFQEHPSVANIVATGSGVLQMTPVLHVK